jgi:hypothetical protein
MGARQAIESWREKTPAAREFASSRCSRLLCPGTVEGIHLSEWAGKNIWISGKTDYL